MTLQKAMEQLVFNGFYVEIKCKHHNGGYWTTEFEGNFKDHDSFKEGLEEHCTGSACVDSYDADEIAHGLVTEGRWEDLKVLCDKVEDGMVVYVEGFGHPKHDQYVRPSEAPDIIEVCMDWLLHDYQDYEVIVTARVFSISSRWSVDEEAFDKTYSIDDFKFQTETTVLQMAALDYAKQMGHEIVSETEETIEKG